MMDQQFMEAVATARFHLEKGIELPGDALLVQAADRIAQLGASVLQAGQVAVDRNALQALMITGSYLATAAYNLKQQDTLKPEWRQSLGTGQTEWDAALANLRRTSQTTKEAALQALRPAVGGTK